LAKPGRDPRAQFEVVQFKEGIHSIDQVNPGMKLTGIVTNITNFGCFVDIGVHQDGLVHISEMADQFVKNTTDVVQVHQKVSVTVLEVDIPRQRIALSMRQNPTVGGSGRAGGAPAKEGVKSGAGMNRPTSKTPVDSGPKRKPLYGSF